MPITLNHRGVAEPAVQLEHHFDPTKWEVAYTGKTPHGRDLDFDVREHVLEVMTYRILVSKRGTTEPDFQAEIELKVLGGALTFKAAGRTEAEALKSLGVKLQACCKTLKVAPTIKPYLRKKVTKRRALQAVGQ